MMEFCDPESFRIVLGRSDAEPRVYLLRELLPEGFGPDNLRLISDRPLGLMIPGFPEKVGCHAHVRHHQAQARRV